MWLIVEKTFRVCDEREVFIENILILNENLNLAKLFGENILM